MKKIGLFYGPIRGSVEQVATKIAKQIGEDKVDVRPVKEATAKDFDEYKNIILGISTIGSETWQSESPANDWDKFLSQLDHVNYTDKTFALFGLGDHISYPLHFVDALGILGKILIQNEAKIIGRVPTENYEFEDSGGVIDGKFIGLPIDEDFEADKTDSRIEEWLDLILPLFS